MSHPTARRGRATVTIPTTPKTIATHETRPPEGSTDVGRRIVAVAAVLAFLVLIVVASPANAFDECPDPTLVWIGPDPADPSGDWLDGDNWEGGDVPDGQTTPCLPDLGTPYTVVLDDDAEVAALLVLGAPSSWRIPGPSAPR